MEEESYFDIVLKYGLYLAGIFQLICLVALIFVPTTYLKKMEKERKEIEENLSANKSSASNNEMDIKTGNLKSKSTEKLHKRR